MAGTSSAPLSSNTVPRQGLAPAASCRSGRAGEEGDQMSAGRMPHQHDIVAVDAEVFGFPLHGSQRSCHVPCLFQRRGLGLHAVVDAGKGNAARYPARYLVVDDASHFLVAEPPGSAMNHQDQRRFFAERRSIEVEALFRRRAIGYVAPCGRCAGLRRGELSEQEECSDQAALWHGEFSSWLRRWPVPSAGHGRRSG